jgi:hypothetical protein
MASTNANPRKASGLVEHERLVDGLPLGAGQPAGELAETVDIDGADLLDQRARLSSSEISGRIVAGAPLREVGATIAVESPSSSSACTITTYGAPACSRPRRADGRIR